MAKRTQVHTRAARFFDQFTRHLFLESLEYVWAALKRIWTRVVVFCCGESILEFFSNKTLYKKIYKTLSPQQKTTTLVKILFRAAHTYSKDSKKRCLVNWSKNRAALLYTQLNSLPKVAIGSSWLQFDWIIWLPWISYLQRSFKFGLPAVHSWTHCGVGLALSVNRFTFALITFAIKKFRRATIIDFN